VFFQILCTLCCPANAYIMFTPRMLPMWNRHPETSQ
jgi:hypothetical protein